MTPTTLQITSLVIFAIALIHVFTASQFEKLAHRSRSHSGV